MIRRACPAASSCARERGTQPFRIFFLFAAVDAIIAVALWFPKLLGISTGYVAGVSLAVWHRDELLFGMMPAVLAGFVLTALPRWTRLPQMGRSSLMLLAGLWLAGRITHAAPAESFVARASAPSIALVFIITLAFLAARHVIASRAWREVKIVLLLTGFAIATGLPLLQDGTATHETAMRLGLACVLGLVVVLGGRIAPALTVAWLKTRGEPSSSPCGRCMETTAALAVAMALGAWVIAPSSSIAAIAAACASIAQMARLLRWQGWRVAGSVSLLALHIAYGWVPVGFALCAAAVVWPSFVSEAAAIHAWALGAIGLMSVAIMASMIRRHSRTPFAFSALVSVSLVCAAVAAPARVVAEFTSDGRILWLFLSAISWVSAFLLFVLAFKRSLLRRARCRSA